MNTSAIMHWQPDRTLTCRMDLSRRVLAQSNFFGTMGYTFFPQVMVNHVPTLFTSFGRWFEGLFVAGFVGVVGWTLISKQH
jgi:hypothetical protein